MIHEKISEKQIWLREKDGRKIYDVKKQHLGSAEP